MGQDGGKPEDSLPVPEPVVEVKKEILTFK